MLFKCFECVWKAFEVFSKIIIPMTKNQTVDKSANIFTLSRFKAGCYYNTISVDFNSFHRPNNLFESIVPIFNQDRNCTTPAFILPNEQHYYSKNINFEKQKFEERIMAAQEKNSIDTQLNPMPSSTYCQICKETYDDYHDHISSKYHIRHLKASKANGFIGELVTLFNKKTLTQDQIGKTKNIKKATKRKTETRSKKSSKALKITEAKQIKPDALHPKMNNYSTNIISELAGTV